MITSSIEMKHTGTHKGNQFRIIWVSSVSQLPMYAHVESANLCSLESALEHVRGRSDGSDGSASVWISSMAILHGSPPQYENNMHMPHMLPGSPETPSHRNDLVRHALAETSGLDRHAQGATLASIVALHVYITSFYCCNCQ